MNNRSQTCICVAEEDFHDVHKAVIKLKGGYYQFGIGLGLPPHQLDTIRRRFPTDIDQAFAEVLLTWLKHCYNTEKHGPPTWQRLVEAVDSPAGGNNHALARTIAAHHLCSFRSTKGGY